MMSRRRSESGAASLGAVAGVAAILVVVLGIVFLQRGSGGDDVDPTSSEQSSETTSESPSETASSTDEPADEAWLAEAVAAAKDGYPAFVPAEVPAGWTATDAAYVPDTSWHLGLTAPSGATVSIDQRSSGKVPAVVDGLIGKASTAGTVNLKRWGTGTWQAYRSGDSVALAQELTGTVVVVSGATTKDEVVEITKQLLTAEMVVNVGDGSDG